MFSNNNQYRIWGLHTLLVLSHVLLLLSTGCGCGIRKELIPVYDAECTLSKLGEDSFDEYNQLAYYVTEMHKPALSKLDQHIQSISNVDELQSFIKESLPIWKSYKEAVLSERDISNLNQQIDQAKNFTEVQAAIQTFLEKYPSSSSSSTSSASQPSESTSQSQSQSSSSSSDGNMQQSGQSDADGQGATKGKAASPQAAKSFAAKTQKSKSPASTTTSPTPIQKPKDEPEFKDAWGEKLPLKGNERKLFLRTVACFKSSPDKSIPEKKKDKGGEAILHEMFKEIEEHSLENFFKAYFNLNSFESDEHLPLLVLMVTLYKWDPNLTLRLCNDPQELTLGQKLRIFSALRDEDGRQLKLLYKLRDAIEALP